MEKQKTHFGWSIGFWFGVAVISLINILLILLRMNQLAYDFYISCASLIALVLFSIILIRRKRREAQLSVRA